MYTLSRPWSPPGDSSIKIISLDPAIVNFGLRIELRTAAGHISTLCFENICLRGTDPYQQLTAEFDKRATLWADAHLVIIERQLPRNTKALRIMQHAISYFYLCTRHWVAPPVIAEVAPRLKTSALSAPKGENLKLWSVRMASEILQAGGDLSGLKKLQSAKKRDDLADTVCQIAGLLRVLTTSNVSSQTAV